MPGCDEIFVTFGINLKNGITIQGDITDMELREGQEFDLEAILRTASGHSATYQEGSASFESSNPDVVGVFPNAAEPDNPLKATIKGLDGSNNGSALIRFHADGDPDGEVRDIVLTLDVTCSQGEAFVGELSPGPVRDSQPAVPAEPGTTEPGTTEPGTTEPGTTEPGTTEEPPV